MRRAMICQRDEAGDSGKSRLFSCGERWRMVGRACVRVRGEFMN